MVQYKLWSWFQLGNIIHTYISECFSSVLVVLDQTCFDLQIAHQNFYLLHLLLLRMLMYTHSLAFGERLTN